MAAKFLCCLPLRFGVLVISLVQFLLCAALAASLWWALVSGDAHNADLATIIHTMKTVVIVAASVHTAAALVGLLGFFGAVFRKNALVKIFYVLLAATLALEVGSSVWYLVSFYRNRSQTLDECIAGSTDQARIAYCRTLDAYRRVPQGVLIAAVVVPLVVQAYACYVVYQYSKRLERLKAEVLRATFVPPLVGQTNALRAEETQPLTHQYPYSDAPHAFGQKADSKV